ncbi:MAG: D-erythronate dehydrogenase [Vicinamibacterales bacterium]
MNVLITGGAGFLGQRLAARLREHPVLLGTDGREERVDRIVLLDVTVASGADDHRVVAVAGDVSDRRLLEELIQPDTTAIFHLAAVVSGAAEADFDLGMRINLDASRQLLEVCRQRGHRPTMVFTSSVAVFGGDLPDVVQDSTAVNPQSSYGAEKAIAELLVSDYSRRGFVDGRVLRLPTVSVRPGRPNAAVSSFASGIIREPLNGEPAVCPVAADTRLWILSPSRAVDALVRAQQLPGDALGRQRVVNLPGLSVTVAEMVQALERVGGPQAASLIRWEPDARIQQLVSSWPGAFSTPRGRALGFEADSDIDAVVRAYIAEQAT